jgi:hypothetical protein
MHRKHGRPDFYVTGEGIYGGKKGYCRTPNAIEETRKFRFSRIGPKGPALAAPLLEAVAKAMVPDAPAQKDSYIPAGYTYLGQLVDHDLTLDKTATKLGDQVSVEDLVQGRSPALDLDCLYGLGPLKDPQFYSDGLRLKVGSTAGSNFPPNDPVASQSLQGFDLPRVGVGQTKAARRRANIPDQRNDENLAVAQIHLAFIHFHNAVVEQLTVQGQTGELFERARDLVVKHYQYMLRHDFLARICDRAVVEHVFTQGRRLFEVPDIKSGTAKDYVPLPSGVGMGSMPIEFSVAAFRFGHSMVRQAYDWNRVFDNGAGTLELLFQFSGTSGTLSPEAPSDSPEDAGSFEVLPTNWIANFHNLFETSKKRPNLARKIDTILSLNMGKLPLGSFGGTDQSTFGPELQRQLAFRNLLRAGMVQLATGQQMVSLAQSRGVELTPLTPAQILTGNGEGADLSKLGKAEADVFTKDTPLWFYVLREAELAGGNHLGLLGSRLVAETFHRAMETSVASIVREPLWKPTFGNQGKFTMIDLLRFAHGEAGLNPLESTS